MLELIVATHNAHKVEEMAPLLAGLCSLRSASEVGITESIPEDHDTLEANALQKASYVHQATGLDTFADDTGLEVHALHGAPGVYSARYAGPSCTPADNVRKLIENMLGVEDRRARFRTVIALIYQGQEFLFEGVVEGTILHAPTGAEGFGYDPIFQPTGECRSFAQMPLAAKNAISHRGRAVAALVEFLKAQSRMRGA